ncbi:TonB-dependent receptor (plasmid) [Sphingopyxis lindanitolerans]|uniref:TonB-dependent receptor n=1 Tax=Sphingopyxis lindanitolerans TaxID=2054227 RepID=A0A2S8B004_9SPHN|nr:TonB-dependent receptor [Sphingopyxis lindanitolerans]PQM25682.1 TonB-dependent receptor [Sphingopyxis lindanitolerans]
MRRFPAGSCSGGIRYSRRARDREPAKFGRRRVRRYCGDCEQTRAVAQRCGHVDQCDRRRRSPRPGHHRRQGSRARRPGLTFAVSQKGAPVYTIRGVGYYEESLAASPAVSVYVDQIGYSFPIEAKAAGLDLERVEVLKGPQGTLFGQSSTGGAINYIAARPTHDFEAGFTSSLERFGRFQFEGYASGPITDTLRTRVAVATEQFGAWQKSHTRNDEIGDADVFKGRWLTDWTPNDRLTVQLNINGWSDRSDPNEAALLAVTPQTPSRIFPIELTQPIAPNKPGVADWSPDFPQQTRQDFWQAALHVDYDLTDDITLTSLSSYQNFRQHDARDTDGSTLSVFHVRVDGSIDSYSQELRLAGRAFDRRLNWMIGGFYSHDRVNEVDTSRFDTNSSNPVFAAFGVGNLTGIGAKSLQHTETKAVFGNIDFDVTDQITLHGGARYTKTDIDFTGCTFGLDTTWPRGINILQSRLFPTGPRFPVEPLACAFVGAPDVTGLVRQDLKEDNVSWRAGVDFKPVPGTLLYGTVSKGYKPGSFGTINASAVSQLAPVVQESVLAYELGFKTDLGLRAIDLTGAVFYYDYTNKQIRGRILDPNGVLGAIEALVNVPKSRVKGAELNLTIRPVDGLTLNGGAVYLDTKVSRDFNNYDPFGAPVNYKGDPFPFTPKWTLRGSANYSFPIAEGLDANLGGDVSYQSKSYSAFGLNPAVEIYPDSLFNIKSYALVNLQAGVSSADGKWQVSIYGKNVFNKFYWTDVFRQIDNTSRHIAPPATYGVRVQFKFGA